MKKQPYADLHMALAIVSSACREADLLTDSLIIAAGSGENGGRANVLVAQSHLSKVKAHLASARQQITNEIFAAEKHTTG